MRITGFVLFLLILSQGLYALEFASGLKDADRLIKAYQTNEANALLLKLESLEDITGEQLSWVAFRYQWNTDKPEKALMLYEQAEKSGYRAPWVSRGKAALYYNQREYQKALSSINQAFKLLESDSIHSTEQLENLGWRARIYNALSTEESYRFSLADIRKAYLVQPNFNNWYCVDSGLESFMMNGYIELGNGAYDIALDYFRSAQKLLSNQAKASDYKQKASELPYLIQWTEERKALGVIKPLVKHKFMSYYILKSDLDFTNSNGKRIVEKSFIRPEEISNYMISQRAMVKVMEALSGGNVTLSFTNVFIDSTLTNIEIGVFTEKYKSEKSIITHSPRQDFIVPSIDKQVEKDYLNYDSFILYWQGEKAATVATGGLRSLFLATMQLETPLRSVLFMPINWYSTGSLSLLMHEFFHSIEGFYQLPQTHGFHSFNRHIYPEWKGADGNEYDYYHWHFKTTINRWTNFDILSAYPAVIPESIINLNRAKAAEIPPADLALSWTKGKKADDLAYRSSKREADQLYREAYRLNPNNISALRYLAGSAMSTSNYQDSLKYYKAFNRLAPEWWSLNSEGYLYLYRMKDPKKAAAAYQASLALKPGVISTYQELAAAYRESGKPLLAVNALAIATNLSGTAQEKANALFWIGYIEGEFFFNYAKAALTLDLAFQTGCDFDWGKYYYQYYVKIASNLNTLGSTPESLSLNIEAADQSAADYIKANQLWDKEDKDKAIPIYRKVLEVNPLNYNALQRLSDFEFKNENIEAGLQYLELCAKIRPEDWIIRNCAWYNQWKLKDYDKALYYFQALDKTGQINTQDLINWGRALLELKQPDEASLKFEKAARLKTDKKSDTAEAVFWKGFIEGEFRDNKKLAFRLIKQAIDNGYDNSYSQWYLKKYSE